MNLRDPQFQKQALFVLVPLVMAVAFQQLVYSKRQEQIVNLEVRVESLQAQNNAMRVVVARYGNDLERRVAIFREHLVQLEQLIPNREDVPHLINQITEVAGSSGVELATIRPRGETAGDHYNRQTYELEIAGDYHSIAEYLTFIGSLPRIVRSAHVHIARRDGANAAAAPALLRVRFRIDTYVMPGADDVVVGSDTFVMPPFDDVIADDPAADNDTTVVPPPGDPGAAPVEG
jgi:Tfp pilus assembly protein PilO